ncbi:MAG: hypothetical protein OD918_05375 [Gammaproteobacteria bacterium]
MEKTQTTDETTVDSLVKGAPRFWLGPAAMKQHIVAAANALLEKVPERFTAEGAKKAAEDHGLFDKGNQFSFQDECKAAYEKGSLEAGRVVGEIVARERSRIDSDAGSFPDMEGELSRLVTKKWANKHLDCAKEYAARTTGQKKFLRARGLPVDGSMTIRGEYGIKKFWLPLGVLIIAEFFGNYLLLGQAGFREKLVIALASVAVVLITGVVISWFLKARHSVVVRDNRWASMQKTMCWAVVAFFGIVFVMALFFFVVHRAGSGPGDVPILGSLAKVLSNSPADFGLALFNILFFGVTIVACYKAGWPLHGYGNVHKELQSAKNAYERNKHDADDAVAKVFDDAHDEVKKRRADVLHMSRAWNTVCRVFAEIPKANLAAKSAIDARYTNAIKIYRSTFAEYRGDAIDADLRQNRIPEEIRENAPITPLESITDHPVDDDLSKHQEQMKSFGERADEWERNNSDSEKLARFSEERKANLIESVKKEKREELQAAAAIDDEPANDGQR